MATSAASQNVFIMAITPTLISTRRYAKEAAKLAITSPTVPRGLLPPANALWRESHPETCCSIFHQATDHPWTNFDQQLGLISSLVVLIFFCLIISSHIVNGKATCSNSFLLMQSHPLLYYMVTDYSISTSSQANISVGLIGLY